MKENEVFELYEGLKLSAKKEPTAQDLIDLRELGIDLMHDGDYARTVLKCFLNMDEMKKLVTIIFEGNIPEVIESKIKAPVIEAALKSFFGKFGLHFG